MSIPNTRRRQDRLRYDHHESYIAWHLGLVVVTIGIILSPIAPPGSIIPFDTEKLMCVCMAIGSGNALIGALIGTRVFFPDTVRRPLDLRIPYGFALFSIAATTTSMGVMMWITYRLLGGSTHVSLAQFLQQIGLGGAFIATSIPMAFRLAHEMRVRTRIRREVIQELESP